MRKMRDKVGAYVD